MWETEVDESEYTAKLRNLENLQFYRQNEKYSLMELCGLFNMLTLKNDFSMNKNRTIEISLALECRDWSV